MQAQIAARLTANKSITGTGVPSAVRTTNPLAAPPLLIQSVQQNYVDGDRRQQEVHQDLSNQFPNASVQDEQYLQDSSGKIVIDPNTGTARRLDHVVIQDGKVVDVVETTSLTANKNSQIQYEADTRKAGGTYIFDRTTGKLLEVPSTSRIVRKP